MIIMYYISITCIIVYKLANGPIFRMLFKIGHTYSYIQSYYGKKLSDTESEF